MPAAGKEYAINQLVLFLAITSLACDWTRTRTDKSGEHPKHRDCQHTHTHLLSLLSLDAHCQRWLPVRTLRTLAGAGCSQPPVLPCLPPFPAPTGPLCAADLMAYLPTIYPHDSLIAIRPRGSTQ